MSTATRIAPARRTVRVAPRRTSSAAPPRPFTAATEPAPGPVHGAAVVELVKSSAHLLRIIGAQEEGREKDLLRMVASYLLEAGTDYPRAEVLEVLRCFTGCGQEAAGEALQLLVENGTVTEVNEVIRVTW